MCYVFRTTFGLLLRNRPRASRLRDARIAPPGRARVPGDGSARASPINRSVLNLIERVVVGGNTRIVNLFETNDDRVSHAGLVDGDDLAVIVEPVRLRAQNLNLRGGNESASKPQSSRSVTRSMDETSRRRARASHTRRETRRERVSLGRASARLLLLSTGHDSSSSPSPTTDRITRARAPWSLSAGRFVPWPPASASPPASIAHKKYPPIVSHRTTSPRASRRRASSPFVNPSRIQRIIESSSSRRRPTSASARTTVRDARVVFVALRNERTKISYVSLRVHRTISSVARASRSTDPTPRSRSREGADRYARARPPW